MSISPQGESLKTSPTLSTEPAGNTRQVVPLSEVNKPVSIFIQDDPDLTRAIWRALCVCREVRATYIIQLSDGLQRVDVWKRRTA